MASADPPPSGLCEHCRHSRAVPGARSNFWLCKLSETDPKFPRYPRIPVLSCEGFIAAVEPPPQHPRQ